MSISILDVDEEYADFLHDESRREGRADKIAFPTSTEDVKDALTAARENGWPITVQGGRTGITGGCVPEGGLILNLSRMQRIGQVDDNRLSVQPGAVLADIREAVADSGFFFPSDLTETSATIGGMIANNASGARSYRYGSVRPWICGLTVVLPNGEVVKLERGVHKAEGLSFQLGSISGRLPELPMPRVKTAAGYFVKPDMDLVDLFIGAEGTLGVVTEITLQLKSAPAQMIGLTAFFAAESEALEFVRFLRGAGWSTRPTQESGTKVVGPLPSAGAPVAIEFFDSNALDLLRRMKSENVAFTDLPELKPAFHTAIYFEFEDDVPEAVVERMAEAIDCWYVEGEHEIETLKNFRHAIPESVNLLIAERKKSIPELTKLGTDMSVPDGQLENVMRMYHTGLAETGLEYVVFGHIGDNHVHVNILPRSMAEYEKGKALYLKWAEQVVAMGGSVSAEHGIGKIKTEFLKLMFGEEGIQKMQSLKRVLDPDCMLNPGNLFRA